MFVMEALDTCTASRSLMSSHGRPSVHTATRHDGRRTAPPLRCGRELERLQPGVARLSAAWRGHAGAVPPLPVLSAAL
jgi:hypothetical protein